MNNRFDLLVVGGGLAGLTAANRGVQLGMTVAVLEKGTDARYLCNTRYTGGTLHICLTDIMSGEAAHVASIERLCDEARPDLVRAIASNAERAVRWLQSEGSKFIKASASPHHRWVLAPPGRTRPGLEWEGRAGDLLLRRLSRNLNERGGELILGSRAQQLLVENGRCVGVQTEIDGTSHPFTTQAVVLADGGFQAAPELLRKHIAKAPERLHQRNAGTGTGDGLQMALQLGAAAVGLNRFYGHLISLDALTNENLWPYPYFDSLVAAAILVDGEGERIDNEGLGGVHAANAVASLDDPQSAFVVFDQEIWDGAGRHGLISVNPHLTREGGTLHRADTLENLAILIGTRELPFTINAYNRAVERRSFNSLSPPRTTLKGTPIAIRKAPFYAAPVCAGITYTMGGIAIDGDARVLRGDDSVIEGLYAAGTTIGGLEGGSASGYVGGLSQSVITGLLAAEHAAEMKEVSDRYNANWGSPRGLA